MSRVFSFRFDEKTVRDLEYCCEVYKLTPPAFLALKIHQEAELAKGNPQIGAVVDKLEELSKITIQINNLLR